MKKVSVNRQKMKKIFIWLIIAFMGVFILRGCYEVYFSRRDMVIQYDGAETAFNFDSVSYMEKAQNVATERISQTDLTGQSFTIDQKYEKTASLSSNTTGFSEDERKIRQVINNNEAVIQSENMRGIEGSQVLALGIGVKPDNFETLVAQIREIGEVTSFMIDKVDRTEEYLRLLAEQATLEKTRDSYIQIRDTGAGMQDLIAIEGLILGVERELQNLGVNMGVFSTEYSFCTVNLTLREQSGISAISLRFVLRCVGDAFTWTALLFLGVGLSVLGVLFGIWLILLLLSVILNFTKKEIEIVNKNEEKNDNNSYQEQEDKQ